MNRLIYLLLSSESYVDNICAHTSNAVIQLDCYGTPYLMPENLWNAASVGEIEEFSLVKESDGVQSTLTFD